MIFPAWETYWGLVVIGAYYSSLNLRIMISSSESFFSGTTIFWLMNSPTGASGAAARAEKNWIKLLLMFTYFALPGCRLYHPTLLLSRLRPWLRSLPLLWRTTKSLAFCFYHSRRRFQFLLFHLLVLSYVHSFWLR